MRIAIYQSDATTAQWLEQKLCDTGHHVFILQSRYDLLLLLDRSTMDLVITEWRGMLSIDSHSGHWLVREARKSAILFTTTIDYRPPFNIAHMLPDGSITFVELPASNEQLQAEINSIIARAYPHRLATRLEVGPYSVDILRRTIHFYNDELRKVTERTFRLAYCFLVNLGRPLSRDYLREYVGGAVEKSESRYLDSSIVTVKALLKIDKNSQFVIRSIYGFGYVFETRRPIPILPPTDPKVETKPVLKKSESSWRGKSFLRSSRRQSS